MPEITDLVPQMKALLERLDKQAVTYRKLDKYMSADSPVPKAIIDAKLRRSYESLMGMSQAPWAALVVDSVQDRLEVGGMRTGDKATDDVLWRIWHANALDAEAKLAHDGALTHGRAFATIWPSATEDADPEIVYDSAEQMAVAYHQGRHQPRHRIAALRRWTDDDEKACVTLYRADGLYKFRETQERTPGRDRIQVGELWLEQRQESGDESWPVENSYGVVPVVELATNRKLQSGAFPYARGEFEHCTGLIDRINLLTFLGLVVAVWMGFPLRGVIGDKILRDDDGNELAPFESRPDSIVQLENPDSKIFQLDSADRKNLSIYNELGQFAYVTKTPAHYFPSDSGFSNISAETVLALEGGLHAKVDGIHKPFLGVAHEETLRVAALMLPEPVVLSPTASVWWKDKTVRSLAESADAAVKLKDLLPWQVIAEKYLGAAQEDINRWEALRASDAITRLMAQIEAPPDPSTNGSAPEPSLA